MVASATVLNLALHALIEALTHSLRALITLTRSNAYTIFLSNHNIRLVNAKLTNIGSFAFDTTYNLAENVKYKGSVFTAPNHPSCFVIEIRRGRLVLTWEIITQRIKIIIFCFFIYM